MKVRSNKIEDVVKYYSELLEGKFEKKESKFLIRILIEEFLEIPKHLISLNLDKRISESQLLKIHFAVKDLIKNIPIQYILSKANFLNYEFYVDNNVLIPRPETEELVNLIISENDNCGQSLNIIDIGSGSGCISISLQNELDSNVIGIDISENALNIAKKNAKRLNSKAVFIKLDILDENLWSNIEGNQDIIVSNPPYVRNSERKEMEDNVVNNEPEIALYVNDENPLIFYKKIAEFALQKLSFQGKLYFEINEYLGDEMKELMTEYFENVKIISDFRGKNRFCICTNKAIS